MKIRQEIIDQINTPEKRTRIALSLKQGEQSVALMCRSNKDNGPLTKAAALMAIRDLTGLTDEEILEAEEPASI